MPDPVLQKRIYRQRLRARLLGGTMLVLSGIAVLTSLSGFFFAADADTTTAGRVRNTFLSAIRPMVDTVYTTKASYLEVDLRKQMLFVRKRDGRTTEYPISTGSDLLHKGIRTRQGIFLVQNKIPMLYSLQFDSARVYNWLGFNFGIGFHSLAGRGYYRFLGNRPSSHGCIRMSEADARSVYAQTSVGTPVFVHDAAYARTVAFLPAGITLESAWTPNVALRIHERRLLATYRGRRLFHGYPLIPLSREYVRHEGLSIGKPERLPARQRIPAADGATLLAVRERTALRSHAADRLPQKLATQPSAMEEAILP